MKITSLHINNINNIEVKYKFIENADINDIIEYKGQSRTIQNIFLDIKINNILLFTGVDQRSG